MKQLRGVGKVLAILAATIMAMQLAACSPSGSVLYIPNENTVKYEDRVPCSEIYKPALEFASKLNGMPVERLRFGSDSDKVEAGHWCDLKVYSEGDQIKKAFFVLSNEEGTVNAFDNPVYAKNVPKIQTVPVVQEKPTQQPYVLPTAPVDEMVATYKVQPNDSLGGLYFYSGCISEGLQDRFASLDEFVRDVSQRSGLTNPNILSIDQELRLSMRPEYKVKCFGNN